VASACVVVFSSDCARRSGVESAITATVINASQILFAIIDLLSLLLMQAHQRVVSSRRRCEPTTSPPVAASNFLLPLSYARTSEQTSNPRTNFFAAQNLPITPRRKRYLQARKSTERRFLVGRSEVTVKGAGKSHQQIEMSLQEFFDN
jgi:hypothetical protein